MSHFIVEKVFVKLAGNAQSDYFRVGFH